MQDKKDALKEGCSQDWRDTRKDGQEIYGMGEILDRRDKGQLGGRTGGMQD